MTNYSSSTSYLPLLLLLLLPLLSCNERFGRLFPGHRLPVSSEGLFSHTSITNCSSSTSYLPLFFFFFSVTKAFQRGLPRHRLSLHSGSLLKHLLHNKLLLIRLPLTRLFATLFRLLSRHCLCLYSLASRSFFITYTFSFCFVFLFSLSLF